MIEFAARELAVLNAEQRGDGARAVAVGAHEPPARVEAVRVRGLAQYRDRIAIGIDRDRDDLDALASGLAARVEREPDRLEQHRAHHLARGVEHADERRRAAQIGEAECFAVLIGQRRVRLIQRIGCRRGRRRGRGGGRVRAVRRRGHARGGEQGERAARGEIVELHGRSPEIERAQRKPRLPVESAPVREDSSATRISTA
ncbi:hypothetical protein DM56_4691 [Burkholderia mallei]|nr:hypothetical protein DM56_4691 [Burkholderia mallei]